MKAEASRTPTLEPKKQGKNTNQPSVFQSSFSERVENHQDKYPQLLHQKSPTVTPLVCLLMYFPTPWPPECQASSSASDVIPENEISVLQVFKDFYLYIYIYIIWIYIYRYIISIYTTKYVQIYNLYIYRYIPLVFCGTTIDYYASKTFCKTPCSPSNIAVPTVDRRWPCSGPEKSWPLSRHVPAAMKRY